jgi:D-sedoheptulose 7-phosphate isomerase
LEHFEKVKAALDTVDAAQLDELIDAILETGLVQTCGNGGSMSTAMHFATDLRSVGVWALAMSSPSTVTQLMNDQGPSSVFEAQAIPGSLIIAFTGSGTSENIERLIYAENSAPHLCVITSTMKEGQRAWDRHPHLTPMIIEVQSDDYEVIEDVHLVICHAVKKLIKERAGK